MKTLALVGNPNSGKTTLFNKLTGLRQKVGNYPGITVEKKEGQFDVDGVPYTVIDLPGAYSLYPKSADEKVVLDTFLGLDGKITPDLVIYVLDANQLDKQMLLLTQLLDCFPRVMVFLNTMDGQILSDNDLQEFKDFFRCTTIMGATRSSNAAPLLKETIKNEEWSHDAPNFFQSNFPDNEVISKITAYSNPYLNYLALANINQLDGPQKDIKDDLYKYVHSHSISPIHLQVNDVMNRYDQLDSVIRDLKRTEVKSHAITDRLDAILSNNIFGNLIFFVTMLIVFQALFTLAQIPMEWIDMGFSLLKENLHQTLPDRWWSNLLVDGIVAGIGGIVVFVPLIFILFYLLGILEDTGYMSRIVYLADGTMRKFGLNGRSVVSMISGAACAIPAVMSARTISNRNERLLTILFTPFISCSARLPVFVILIAIVIPKQTYLGVITSQGLVLTALYLSGIIMALLGSLLFSRFLPRDEHSILMLELPDYKWPNFHDIFVNAWSKVKTFVTEAGKIILIISIILWFAGSYGPPGKMKAAEEKVEKLAIQNQWTEEETESMIQSKKIEASYAGMFGKAIEPAIKPLGYDWKIGIALLTSFAAREVFVSTMSTIYSVGDSNAVQLTEKLRTVKNPDTGKKVFSFATGISLLIFYLLAMQCMSTSAVVRKETGSWKWPIIQFFFMTGSAYLFSFLAYQLLS